MGSVSGVLHVVPADFVSRDRFLPEPEAGDDNSPAREWIRVPTTDADLEFFSDWAAAALFLKVVNKSPTTIGQFAVAVNKSCIGAEIACQPEVPVQLDFGEAFECEIPLRFTESARAPTPELQLALRTSLGIKYLRIPIDLTAVVQSPGEIGERQFEGIWAQGLPEVRVEVANARIADPPTLAFRRMSVVRTGAESTDVAFCLPPGFFFCARVTQAGSTVTVVARGEQTLFAAVRQCAAALFCV
jgi:hypothetical protein